GTPVIDAGAERPPADSFTDYRPSAVAGGRAPHVWLDDFHGPGSALADRYGTGFTVLRLGGCAQDTAPLVAAAHRRGVPLSVLEVPGRDAREMFERDLVLVRPDQHVAWRGNRLPADPDALLARVTGHLPR
ncbi:monooxygenase, partial [Streptomyces sp. NPDC047097]